MSLVLMAQEPEEGCVRVRVRVPAPSSSWLRNQTFLCFLFFFSRLCPVPGQPSLPSSVRTEGAALGVPAQCKEGLLADPPNFEPLILEVLRAEMPQCT